MPMVNTSTHRSKRICSTRGTVPGGASATNPGTPQSAIKIPAAPPASATKVLSVSNCRTSRQRPAPKAVRTAISCCRPAARASNRFATLAQAMSSTNATAPAKIKSDARIFATRSSLSGRICASSFLLSSSGSRGRLRTMVSSSAFACCGETPAFKRPITGIMRKLPGVARIASGVHASES